MKDGQEMTNDFEKGHTRLIFHAEHWTQLTRERPTAGRDFEMTGSHKTNIIRVWSNGEAERGKEGSHKSSGEAERRKKVLIRAAAKLSTGKRFS
jgi:hypothetical protein